jgi:hypothetical protein
VASLPFSEAGRPAPTRVNYAPATKETTDRVLLVHGKLIGTKSGGLPYVTAIGAPEPEIFHVGQKQIFLTEGLVRQCQSDGQLAAVLALEMGRMISEREAAVSDEFRRSDQPLPIELRTGSNGSPRDSDPTYFLELARYEKQHPKQTKKLPPPNPQLIARDLLEKQGFHSTDFDAAMPILQNAERNQMWQSQFKGATRSGDWQPY